MNKAKQQLMLHSGAESISRSDIRDLPVPEPDGTYYPVANDTLLTLVEGSIAAGGMSIRHQQHGYDPRRQRYFGILELECPKVCGPHGDDGASLMEDSFGLLLGIRNSADKSCSAQLVMGSRVFVCDNMSFAGEVKISRRHTRHIARDLGACVHRATSALIDSRRDQVDRFAQYAATRLEQRDACHLVVEAARSRAITVTKMMDVVEQWDRPAHEDFAPRNAWSLYNAFTEIYKTMGARQTLRRSQTLNGIMDAYCGVVAPKTTAQIIEAATVEN